MSTQLTVSALISKLKQLDDDMPVVYDTGAGWSPFDIELAPIKADTTNEKPESVYMLTIKT